jgi:dTDP-4-dehydrorhamnose reductase
VRILITGAGGQLGRDLQEVFAAEKVDPFDHAALDIGDRNAVLETVGRVSPEWVINAAAFNDVDGAEGNPSAALRVNGNGAGYLAEAANAVGAAILHVSTDYVFDGRKGSPYLESDTPNPLSVYGRSKYAGEQRVLAANANSMVLRTAWLYGRHGKNFVKSIRAAAEKGGPLRVVSDQTGSPTSTADLAAAIAGLLHTPIRGILHAVNAGSCSRYEFARAIVPPSVQVIPINSAEAARPAPRPMNATLGSERWALTKLAPLRSWQEALKAFLAEQPPP